MKESLNLTRNYSTARFNIGKYGLLLALIILCTTLAIITPKFLTLPNLMIIVTQVTINALLAFGVTFVIITGGIDLSLGSIVAVTSVITATFARADTYPLVVPLGLGLLVGLTFGAFNGLVITKGKVPPFIVTLGTMTIGRGLALILSKGRPISNLSDAFNYIGGGNLFGIPLPIVILVIVFIICTLLLKKTIMGRYVYAVGGNELAARASGISVNRVKMFVYTLGGGLAALGGIILTSRISTGQPNVGIGFELSAIAAAIIGGTSTSGGVGSITGTLLGALLIGVISNSLDLLNVTSYYQSVVMGLIIIGAVLLDSLNKNKGS